MPVIRVHRSDAGFEGVKGMVGWSAGLHFGLLYSPFCIDYFLVSCHQCRPHRTTHYFALDKTTT
jgi:hypothetical protein